jgi:ABC-type transport system involved in multi-copper enzyme maturation permease subunit
MTLAVAGIRKFSTRSATLVSLIIAVLLVALEFVLLGVSFRSAANQPGVELATIAWFLTFPNAYDAVLSIVFAFGGMIGLIYVAAASGSEWSWGTLKVAVARGESRSRYVFATFASLAAILFVGTVATFAVGIAGAIVGGSIAGLPLGNPGDPGTLAAVALKLIRCWLAITCLASVGYAFAMVAKSQMAGIGSVIGFFIASAVAPALLPDAVQQIFKYLPFSIASDSIGLQGPPVAGASAGAASTIDPTLALLVTLGWLLGCLAITAIATERTEIKG